MVVDRWGPYLVRTPRSFSRRWRSFTRQSAPYRQKMTPAWPSCTSPGSTALGRREPKSCCTHATTRWRRWRTDSLWSGDESFCYNPWFLEHFLANTDYRTVQIYETIWEGLWAKLNIRWFNEANNLFNHFSPCLQNCVPDKKKIDTILNQIMYMILPFAADCPLKCINSSFVTFWKC